MRAVGLGVLAISLYWGGEAGAERAHGDSPELPRLSLGLRFGADLANISGESELEFFTVRDSPSSASNGALGGGAQVSVNYGRYGLRLEALYKTKGAKKSGVFEAFDDAPYEMTYRMRYLVFPLLGVVHIPYDGEISPHFFAGPELAVALSSRASGTTITLNDEGEPVALKQEASLTKGTEPFDLGLTVGAGIRYPWWRGAVTIDIRFTAGMLEAIKDNVVMTSDGVLLHSRSVRNRVFSIGVAYEL